MKKVTEVFSVTPGLKPTEANLAYQPVRQTALGKKTPIGLRDLSDELATNASTKGDQKIDRIPSTPVKVPVGSLKPAQREVIPEKALGFALGFLKMGVPNLNDMEAIISNDQPNPYIMDGHHRWAAATLINPNMEVGVYKINMPAGPLITALNVYTKGMLKKSGNPGKGNIEQWKQLIPKVIDAAVQNGIYYWPLGSQEDVNSGKAKIVGTPQEVQAILTKFGGGNLQVGVNKMKENANKLFTEKFPDAPERIDMPVIEGSENLKKVCDAIASGKIDILPPFNPDVEKFLKLQNQQTNQQTNQQQAVPVKEHVMKFSEFKKLKKF